MSNSSLVPEKIRHAVKPPEKLRREDAAEYLGVEKSTLDTWACRGKGPEFCKVGGKVWYFVDDLDAWLKSRKTNCSSALSAR